MTPFPTIVGFQDTELRAPEIMDTQFHDPRAAEPVRHGLTPLQLVEKLYPRIHRQIVFLWGSKEMQVRFTRWLLTDQEGRRGWPKEVYAALQQLSNEHQQKYDFDVEVIFDGVRDRW